MMYQVKYYEYDSYCQLEVIVFRSYFLMECWELIKTHLQSERFHTKAKNYIVIDRLGDEIDLPIHIKVLK